MTTMTYRTNVESLNLYASDGDQILHYEEDHDLHVHCKAANRGGTTAGLVLVELGIDGYETHRVRFNVGSGHLEETEAFRYALQGDEVRALTDAINAMTALRDELARVQR